MASIDNEKNGDLLQKGPMIDFDNIFNVLSNLFQSQNLS